MQKKIGAAVLAAAAISLTFAGPAHAETNPKCSSVTQIGSSGARGQQEVWSNGANTLRFCTSAIGFVSGGDYGQTEERC